MAISKAFTDGQLAELVALRTQGADYPAIAASLSKKYGTQWSDDSIRRAYNAYSYLFETENSVGSIATLKSIARVKRASSQTAKENRTILQALNDKDDLLEQLRTVIEALPKQKAKKVEPIKKTVGKTDMTVEALLSDLHFGKKTDTFDVNVARKRMRQFTTVLLQEIDRKQAHYNVERIILAILGDLIENALMHGRESAIGCEFGNAEQVSTAIEIIFKEVLLPLSERGIPMNIVCINGNHDRESEKPTYQVPGKNSLSWIIYQALRMLAERAGLGGLTWYIPEGAYQVLDVYGDAILYEHGDRIAGDNTKRAFLAHMTKRGSQVNRVIKGMRLGHWHEFSCFDNGRVVVNASLPGQDSYADVQGFASIPGQVINYYVKTKNRDNSYYYSFLVNLT